MKNLLAITICLTLTALPVFAEGIAPKWQEFCRNHCNDSATSWLPKKRYWAERRQQFESELKTCESTTTDKTMCYMQIRQIESSKNDSYAIRRAIKIQTSIKTL